MGIELAKTDGIYFLVGSAFIFMEEIVDHVVNAALHCGAIIHAYFSCFLRNTLSVFVEKRYCVSFCLIGSCGAFFMEFAFFEYFHELS